MTNFSTNLFFKIKWRYVQYVTKPRNAEGACSVYLGHVSVFCLLRPIFDTLSILFSNSEKIYTYTDGMYLNPKISAFLFLTIVWTKPRNAEGACSVYLGHVSVFCLLRPIFDTLSILFSNSEKIYTYTDGNC